MNDVANLKIDLSNCTEMKLLIISCLLVALAFEALVRPTEVQLLDFFCSSVSVLVLLLSTHFVLSQ